MFGLEPKIIIFDTEYTAWEGTHERGWDAAAGQYREIVEIGAVKVATESMSELKTFNAYVRPVKNPKLSEYFIRLTGITQEIVEREGIDYAKALENFTAWAGRLALYSWGGDLYVLKENAELLGIKFPLEISRFKDVREIFGAEGIDVEKYMSSTIPRAFGEEPEHRAHNSLNDARSILQALRALKDRKCR